MWWILIVIVAGYLLFALCKAWWEKAKEKARENTLKVCAEYINEMVDLIVSESNLNFSVSRRMTIASAAYLSTRKYIDQNRIDAPSNNEFQRLLQFMQSTVSDGISREIILDMLYEDFFEPFIGKSADHTILVFRLAAEWLLSEQKKGRTPDDCEIESYLEELAQTVDAKENQIRSARYCLDVHKESVADESI